MDSNGGRGAVVVTGASTGIGRAIVEVLVRHGLQVFGSVRKQEDAARLSAEIGDGFTPIVFDVTDDRGVASAVQAVSTSIGGTRLAGLVNNAGIGMGGPLLYQPEEEVRRVFDVNFFGPLKVIRGFAPLLGTDPGRSGPAGRIVNISSAGGRIGGPFLGAYAASKHALEGMSESLRRELLLHGIDVIIVGPGGVDTPIWSKAERQGYERYENTEYGKTLKGFLPFMVESGRRGLPPRAIGRVVLTALTARRPRVRYAVARDYFTGWWLPTHLPRRRVDRVIGKRLGFL